VTFLLVMLLGLVLLYVGPAHSYWETLQQAKQRRAEVAELKRENDRLRARRSELRSAGALEREARRLGMVRPGERPFVVENLPKGR
jgi:cell division protein FtsB